MGEPGPSREGWGRADNKTSDTIRVVSHLSEAWLLLLCFTVLLYFPTFVSSVFPSLCLGKQNSCHRAAPGGNATETKTVWGKYTGVLLQPQMEVTELQHVIKHD